MALNVLGNFYAKKSIKLSDAFEVYINNEVHTECVGFTLPKFEQEEDLIQYGNVSQTFLIPKYDSCKEFSLIFYDSIDNPKSVFFKNNITYKLYQKFGRDGLSENYAEYFPKKSIKNITIKVLNNELHKVIYQYVFENCKIVNYSLYNLEYQSDSPCQITFNFSFEGYKKEII